MNHIHVRNSIVTMLVCLGSCLLHTDSWILLERSQDSESAVREHEDLQVCEQH